ncbi:MAG: hypothetical protein ABRQ39_16925 [Candidatus Eremiobacterota bacterium]
MTEPVIAVFGIKKLPGLKNSSKECMKICDGHNFEFHMKTMKDRISYYRKTRKNITFY